MTVRPISGRGTELRRWNSSSGAWEKLAQVKSITGPGMSRETLDTTTLDTTGGYRTFIAGLRDAGEISFAMNWYRDGYDLMKADFESDVEANYEIVLPDDEKTTLEFAGLVTAIPMTIPEGVVEANVTIKISGEVTIESGSGPSPG